MNVYVAFVLATLAAAILFLSVVLVVGYKWGSFAALKALAQNSPKWKAYFLALVPPAAFAITFLFDGNLSPIAHKTFVLLATPAVIGTGLKYNRSSYLTF